MVFRFVSPAGCQRLLAILQTFTQKWRENHFKLLPTFCFIMSAVLNQFHMTYS